MTQIEPVPPEPKAIAIDYGLTDAMIEEKRAKYAELKCDTPAGVEAVRLARADCRTMRKKLDDRKKELNEDAKKWIDQVNSMHKKIYAAVELIEAPLDKEKEKYDKAIEAKKEAKRKEEEAAVAKQLAEKNKAEADRLEAIRIADEKARAAEREKLEADRKALAAEREKLEADKKAAEAKQAEEKAAADAKRAEEAKQEQIRLDAERARLAEEKRIADEAAQKERDRLAEIDRQQKAAQAAIDAEKKRLEDERKAREKAEADRIAAEQAALAEQERIKKEQAAAKAKQLADEERQNRTWKDRASIREFAERLSNLERPTLTCPESVEAMNTFEIGLNTLLNALENF